MRIQYRKPWPLVILATLHFFEPVPKVFLHSYFNGVSAAEYLHNIFYLWNFLELAEFFLLFPIAAFAIFSIKRWSYAVFLSIEAWSVYRLVENHYFNPVLPLPILLSIVFMNLVAVSYFLIPATQEAYFNERIRWWESKPRFVVNFIAFIRAKWGVLPCTIRDISEGGAFVESSLELERFGTVMLQIQMLNYKLELEGKVIHYQKKDEGGQFGIQFINVDTIQKRKIKKFVAAIEVLSEGDGLSRSMRVFNDFMKWLGLLFHHGEGVLPQQPKKIERPKFEISKNELILLNSYVSPENSIEEKVKEYNREYLKENLPKILSKKGKENNTLMLLTDQTTKKEAGVKASRKITKKKVAKQQKTAKSTKKTATNTKKKTKKSTKPKTKKESKTSKKVKSKKTA